MRFARGASQATRGLEGPALERARARAVEAYRAVRLHHPTELELAAEAGFRAGELLRSAGLVDEAESEFRTVRQVPVDSDFRGRALLEIGHLQRRATRPEEALDAYVALALDSDARRVDRDRAAFWAGRVHATAGRVRAARRMWIAVANGAADPVLRVSAHDELIECWLQLEDLEAAAGQLELCRADMRELAGEVTLEGRRVRRALENMDSVERLLACLRARAEPDRSSGDP